MFMHKFQIFFFVMFTTLAILFSPIFTKFVKPVQIIKFIDPNKIIDDGKERIMQFYQNLEHEELLKKDSSKKPV